MNEHLTSPKNYYALLVDPHTGQEYNLKRLANSIGRSVASDITLALDKTVSRQHAIVYCVGGKFFLEDVGSTNGTMVNGVAIKERTLLNSGDEIRVGLTRLVFVFMPNRLSLPGMPVSPSPQQPAAKSF